MLTRYLSDRLITDREERFTSVQEVKDHPWFNGLDWSQLRSMVSVQGIASRLLFSRLKKCA